MKIRTIPQRGKLGDIVASKNHYGPHHRKRPTRKRPFTATQTRTRAQFGHTSSGWSAITDAQRQGWCALGKETKTTSALGVKSSLTGQNTYTRINNARAAIRLPPLADAPAHVRFDPEPVTALRITNIAGRVSLELMVSGHPAGHIEVYGSPHFNAGRLVCWDLRLLGCMADPKPGWNDITDLYWRKFDLPPVGKRVFIRVRQQINGWQGLPRQMNALVPPSEKPARRPSNH